MMLFKQPDEPPEFATEVGSVDPNAAEPPEIWRKAKYKKAFSDAQHGRCGYCDRLVDPNEYGDVDHYRPKGRVDEMDDPKAEAKCLREEPPRVKAVSADGYDWLRYSWANYLFACEKCNRRFKRCLFPVTGGSRTLPLTQQGSAAEQALLLWCYGTVNPGDHLELTRVGSIGARNGSLTGKATILTCGLSRGRLQQARLDRCEAAFESAELILKLYEKGTVEAFRDALHACLRKGANDRDLAGVFRIIVEHELGLSWQEIESLVSP